MPCFPLNALCYKKTGGDFGTGLVPCWHGSGNVIGHSSLLCHMNKYTPIDLASLSSRLNDCM